MLFCIRSCSLGLDRTRRLMSFSIVFLTKYCTGTRYLVLVVVLLCGTGTTRSSCVCVSWYWYACVPMRKPEALFGMSQLCELSVELVSTLRFAL